MIRLTFYSILAVIIALAAAWISASPGQVLITWQGWEIRFSVAVMVFLLVLYTIFFWFLVWFIKKLNIVAYFTDPRRLHAKRKKGDNDLDQAWSAFALEDYKEALKLGLRAKSKLGETGGVLRLLASTTIKLNSGENPYLEALRKIPSSVAWVEKQELDSLIEQKAWDKLGPLIKDLLTHYPKNKNLLKLNFLVTARLGNWQSAKVALNSAIEQKNVFNQEEQKHYQAVIDYCLSLEEKAAGNKVESINLLKASLKYDPAFSPAATSAARSFIERDDKRSAEKVLNTIWKVAPTWEIAELIADLYPAESSNEAFRRVKKLTDGAPEFVESQHLLAQVAISAKQWPDARKALEKVINSSKASQKTFMLMAQLEQKQKNDQKAADVWKEKSDRANQDNHWSCTSCQKKTAHYLPVCPSCNEFDTIKWQRN
ncbi:MAG: heme biosynthesis HemY N-terminal domain-containing protein [Emcibacteraceae bacterium]